MTRTAVVSARIDPELKGNAERVFTRMGLTTSEAITLFYEQVDRQGGLPFNTRIPNETTKKALTDAKSRRNLKSFDSVQDLFEELESRGKQSAVHLNSKEMPNGCRGEAENLLISTGTRADLFK